MNSGLYVRPGAAATACAAAAASSLETAASLLSAESPELLAARGEFLYRFEEDFPGALDEQLRAHAVMPGSAAILRQLGYTQRRLGLWEESIESLKQSTVLDPADAGGWMAYAETLTMMQEWARLEPALEAAYERFADEPSITALGAGLPLWTRGDVAASRDQLGKVRQSTAVNYVFTTQQHSARCEFISFPPKHLTQKCVPWRTMIQLRSGARRINDW